MKISWLQIYVLPRKSEDIDIIRHFYLSLTFLIKNISDHLSEVTSIQDVTVIGLVSSFLLLFYWFLGPFTALMMSYVIPSSLFSVFVDFPRLQVLHLYKCIPDFISWLFLNISQWKDEGSIQPSWFLQRPPPHSCSNLLWINLHWYVCYIVTVLWWYYTFFAVLLSPRGRWFSADSSCCCLDYHLKRCYYVFLGIASYCPSVNEWRIISNSTVLGCFAGYIL